MGQQVDNAGRSMTSPGMRQVPISGGDRPAAGGSYWQPMPANGYVTIHLTPETTLSASAAMGEQFVAPGGRVREHAHVDQEEIIHVLSGRGTALVEGVAHAMTPGTALFLRKGVKHAFVNDGDTDLHFAWTIIPGYGLQAFFAAIGRPRLPGQAAPAPFPRPADVLDVEAMTGFVRADTSAGG
jgi:quercetin dioxygenase-like cupin family protein